MKKFKKLLAICLSSVVLLSQFNVFAQAPVPNVVDNVPVFFTTYYEDYYGGLYEYDVAAVFTEGVQTETATPIGYAWQQVGLVVNYGNIGAEYGWYGFNYYAADNSPNEENWVEVYREEDGDDYYSVSEFGIEFNGKYYEHCKYVVTRTVTYECDEYGYCEAIDCFNYELLLPVGYTEATFSLIPLNFDYSIGQWSESNVWYTNKFK